MRLEAMTTAAVRALDHDLPVVIPFAAIEQHGPHLPIGTDSYIVDGIIGRLDARAPEAFVALPVQRFGSSPHHLPFAGTTTLASRTFVDVAVDLAASMIHHGFRRFVLLNGHGGNQAHLDVAVQEIRIGGATRATPDPARREVRIVHATYWRIARDAFAAIRETPPGGMGHACEMETSAMLALHPELVRTELLRPDGHIGRSRFDARDMLDPGAVGQFRFFDEASDAGPIGDPRSASAAKGERFLDAAVDAIIELLEALRAGTIG